MHSIAQSCETLKDCNACIQTIEKTLTFYKDDEEAANEYRILLADLADRKKELDSRKKLKKSRYMWVTVNAKPDVPLRELVSRVHDLASRSFVQSIVYNFEQRSEIPHEYKGFHSHILFERCEDNKPTSIKQNLKRHFKNICDVTNNNVLFIKDDIPEDYVKDKMEYLEGIKDDSKDLKIVNDNLMRSEHNLEKIYKK